MNATETRERLAAKWEARAKAIVAPYYVKRLEAPLMPYDVKAIVAMTFDELAAEHQLINQRQSKLSARLRQRIVGEVALLIHNEMQPDAN